MRKQGGAADKGRGAHQYGDGFGATLRLHIGLEQERNCGEYQGDTDQGRGIERTGDLTFLPLGSGVTPLKAGVLRHQLRQIIGLKVFKDARDDFLVNEEPMLHSDGTHKFTTVHTMPGGIPFEPSESGGGYCVFLGYSGGDKISCLKFSFITINFFGTI